MVASIRQDMARFWLSRIRGGRRASPQPFDLGRKVVTSSNTLIYMPEDLDNFRVARYVFKTALLSEEARRVTLIVAPEVRGSLNLRTSARVLELGKTSLDFWGMPKSEWLGRLRGTEFDVALDLNPDFRLHAACTIRKCCDGVRVGFAWEGAHAFYNVLMERREDKSYIERNYRTMRDELTNLIPLDMTGMSKGGNK